MASSSFSHFYAVVDVFGVCYHVMLLRFTPRFHLFCFYEYFNEEDTLFSSIVSLFKTNRKLTNHIA